MSKYLLRNHVNDLDYKSLLRMLKEKTISWRDLGLDYLTLPHNGNMDINLVLFGVATHLFRIGPQDGLFSHGKKINPMHMMLYNHEHSKLRGGKNGFILKE